MGRFYSKNKFKRVLRSLPIPIRLNMENNIGKNRMVIHSQRVIKKILKSIFQLHNEEYDNRILVAFLQRLQLYQNNNNVLGGDLQLYQISNSIMDNVVKIRELHQLANRFNICQKSISQICIMDVLRSLPKYSEELCEVIDNLDLYVSFSNVKKIEMFRDVQQLNQIVKKIAGIMKLNDDGQLFNINQIDNKEYSTLDKK